MTGLLESVLFLIDKLEKEITIEPDINGVDIKYTLKLPLGDNQFSFVYKIPRVLEHKTAIDLDKATKHKLVKAMINHLVDYVCLKLDK